ncbi:MAG TPA: carboxypeptidase-like regulatory domain-containing protein [Candidatus Nitrosotenuis sp.]|nr:carboxypeptidase-like regulatory domain-containing protein [Candidatus Nitrosotenuis sp.]
MRHRFNEGDPAVFVGKLTTKSGTPVPNSKITIIHDGSCPDKIIAEGKTDKTGRFWIFSSAKIWDKDNLVKVHAEYRGERGLFSSQSENKVIVVLPVQNKSCLD